MATAVLNFLNKQVEKGLKTVKQAMPQEEIPFGRAKVKIVKQLGEGGYAFVYLVEDINSGRKYAMKRMLAADAEARAVAQTEIKVMKSFKGAKNLVKYYDSCMKQAHGKRVKEYFILMELCSRGALLDEIQERIERSRPYKERHILRMFRQTCQAVKFFHTQSPPIQHRDLKIENLLLTADGVIKLCDFGSCTVRSKKYTTRQEILMEEERIQKYTTNCYMAPEMADLYKHEVISEKVDIWALGCILYVLAFFEHPFQDKGNLAIINGTYDIPRSHAYSDLLVDTIKGLLVARPKKRPDIHRAMEMIDEWEEFLDTGKRPAKKSPTGSNKKKERKLRRKVRKKPAKKEAKEKKSSRSGANFDVDWSNAESQPTSKAQAPAPVSGGEEEDDEWDVDWDTTNKTPEAKDINAADSKKKSNWDPFSDEPALTEENQNGAAQGGDIFSILEGTSVDPPKPSMDRHVSHDQSSSALPSKPSVARPPSGFSDPFSSASPASNHSSWGAQSSQASPVVAAQGWGQHSQQGMYAGQMQGYNQYSPQYAQAAYSQQQQQIYMQQQFQEQQRMQQRLQAQQYRQSRNSSRASSLAGFEAAFGGLKVEKKTQEINPFDVGFNNHTTAQAPSQRVTTSSKKSSKPKDVFDSLGEFSGF